MAKPEIATDPWWTLMEARAAKCAREWQSDGQDMESALREAFLAGVEAAHE